MSTSSSTTYPLSDTAVRTTLASAITSTDTSFDVGEVTNAPATPFLIAVWVDQSPLREDDMELMEVTGISGTTLTVNRGQKGTTAQSFSGGDKVFMGVASADVFDEVSGASQALKNTVESNTQTSLENLLRSKANAVEHNNSALDADDTLWDIFYDKSKVFSLSDAYVTDIANDGSEDGVVELKKANIDDFEDGDITGWSGDTQRLSADDTTVINGSYSGKFSIGADFVKVVSPSVSGQSESVWYRFRIGSDTGNSSDYIRFDHLNSSDVDVGELKLEHGSNDLIFNGTTLTSNFWSPDTNYAVELRIDYGNDQVEVFVNGTKQGSTQSLAQSTSEISEIRVEGYSGGSGNTVSYWFDDIGVQASQPGAITSPGTLTSEAKNFANTAGFTNPPDEVYVTLDADIPADEGVTPKIKDSNGNTVTLSIGDFVDTSALTSTEVQAILELTSSDGNDTPTVRGYAFHLREGT